MDERNKKLACALDKLIETHQLTHEFEKVINERLYYKRIFGDYCRKMLIHPTDEENLYYCHWMAENNISEGKTIGDLQHFEIFFLTFMIEWCDIKELTQLARRFFDK